MNCCRGNRNILRSDRWSRQFNKKLASGVGAFDNVAAMPQEPASSRLMVLMFTDLVNSTRLKRELGLERYRPLAQRHDHFIHEALTIAPSGRVLQDNGDGYFIAFDTLSDAINAALTLQWLMHHEPWPYPFATRIGLHLGQVEQLQSEATGQPKFLASATDIAARVMSLAAAGQLLLTRAVFDEARQLVRAHPAQTNGAPAPTLRWIAHGPYQFKGNEEPVDVFEVGVEGVAPFFPPPDSEKARRYIRPGDEITLGWRPAVGQALANSPRWLITEKLGEGGFGEVWLAAHVKAKTRRVFKFCFDAERLRALKREVALFRLLKDSLGDRRDIAPVRDWSFDESPYFIEMEYAAGGNLAHWLQSRGGTASVPLEQRLAIIAGVARALAAAHSIAILHKDIKPANVLMVQDEAGEWYPRLTDFGIGILTDRSRLLDHNITADGFTASNLTLNDSSRTGTRMYSPPESLSSKPHTVQGDIYALGVMLFQLVVGDLARPLATGWERDVPDELLREDIARCVDVDPARRFASAGELAQRLESLPDRRAQRAAQASAARSAERRHRIALLLRRVALLASVLLVLAAAATIYHVHNLHAEQARTLNALENTDAVTRFLTDQVLANAAPEKVHEAEVLRQIVAKMIDPAAAEVGKRFAGKPRIEASVRHEIARAYRKAGQANQALSQIQRALELRKQVLGLDDPATLTSQDFCAVVLDSLGRRKDAEALHKDTLDRRTRTLGPDNPDTLTSLNNYAMVLKQLGRATDAEPLMKDALERRTKVLGVDDPDRLMSLNNYALILQALKRPNQAEPLMKDALDRRTSVLGLDDPDRLSSLSNYGLLMRDVGKPEEAERLLKDALERQRRVLGPTHRHTLLTQSGYAYLLNDLHRSDEAESLFTEAIKWNRQVNGENHPMTLSAINGYVNFLNTVGRANVAEAVARDALQRATDDPNLGIEHPDTRQIAINYAKTLEILQHADRAAKIREKYHLN
jgi:serine/threonine-protein kinase